MPSGVEFWPRRNPKKELHSQHCGVALLRILKRSSDQPTRPLAESNCIGNNMATLPDPALVNCNQMIDRGRAEIGAICERH